MVDPKMPRSFNCWLLTPIQLFPFVNILLSHTLHVTRSACNFVCAFCTRACLAHFRCSTTSGKKARYCFLGWQHELFNNWNRRVCRRHPSICGLVLCLQLGCFTRREARTLAANQLVHVRVRCHGACRLREIQSSEQVASSPTLSLWLTYCSRP